MEEFKLEEVNPKEVLDEQGPNVYLYHNFTKSVAIISGEAWYKRIWLLLSNPFRYLFIGEWRF